MNNYVIILIIVTAVPAIIYLLKKLTERDDANLAFSYPTVKGKAGRILRKLRIAIERTKCYLIRKIRWKRYKLRFCYGAEPVFYGRFLFGHHKIKSEKRVLICLKRKQLIFYGLARYKELAEIPLNQLRAIRIETVQQAVERYALPAQHLKGVAKKYFRGKQGKKVYIFTFHWEDERGIKHDCVVRYSAWHYKQDHVRATNIRMKILNAKPNIDDPDYTGPKLVVKKGEESTKKQTALPIDEDNIKPRESIEDVLKSSNSSSEDEI